MAPKKTITKDDGEKRAVLCGCVQKNLRYIKKHFKPPTFNAPIRMSPKETSSTIPTTTYFIENPSETSPSLVTLSTSNPSNIQATVLDIEAAPTYVENKGYGGINGLIYWQKTLLDETKKNCSDTSENLEESDTQVTTTNDTTTKSDTEMPLPIVDTKFWQEILKTNSSDIPEKSGNLPEIDAQVITTKSDAGMPSPTDDSQYWQESQKNSSDLSEISENPETNTQVTTTNYSTAKRPYKYIEPLELVNLYRKEECLWNTKHPDYLIEYTRRVALTRIATKLNAHNIGVKEVKTKLKTLRNTYVQQLKKYRKNGYKTRLVWFHKMDEFLRPHLHKQFIYEAQSIDTGNNTHLKEEPIEHEFVDTNKLSQDPLDTKETDSDSSDDEPLTLRKSKRLRKRSGSYSKQLQETEEIEKSETSTKTPEPSESVTTPERSIAESGQSVSDNLAVVKSNPTQSNEHDEFLLYVGSLLRKLPSRKGLLLQPQIIKLITDAINDHE